MFHYAVPEVLVDTQWLDDHLGDPQVRIFEGDMNSANYDTGHIPGAIFWNMLATIILPDFRTNLDKSAFEAFMRNSGIYNGTTIVLYSNTPSLAPWGFWFLQLFGHKDVHILNGGRKKWLAEGRSLSLETPEISLSDYIACDPDLREIVSFDDVRNAIDNQGYALVDVRTQKEYGGETFIYNPPQGNERAGHIPRSIHIYYENAMNEDGTFKPPAELEAIYQGYAVTPNKTIIPYCTFGGRTSHTWFVLKYLLGYPDVRHYTAGWMEWSQHPDAIIE